MRLENVKNLALKRIRPDAEFAPQLEDRLARQAP